MDQHPRKIDSIRRRGIYLLPNLLTTAALFAGFYSIVAAIDGNFVKACVAHFIAMAFDGMDGRLARLTKTESDFGKEYDSLSDMVSFGLAPAIVVYQWGLERLAEYGWMWGKLGWLAAFFYAVAAAMRATAIPVSYMNGDAISNARYNCIQCHVPQANVGLLVQNDFGDAKSISRV